MTAPTDLLSRENLETIATQNAGSAAARTALDALDRLTKAERKLAEAKAERKRLADELFDTRNRYGCGPEQSGPDALDALSEAQRQLTEAEHWRAYWSRNYEDLEERTEAQLAEQAAEITRLRAALKRIRDDTYRDLKSRNIARAALEGQPDPVEQAHD